MSNWGGVMLAFMKAVFVWTFKSPGCALEDMAIRSLLRKLRVLTLIWNVGVLGLFGPIIALNGVSPDLLLPKGTRGVDFLSP